MSARENGLPENPKSRPWMTRKKEEVRSILNELARRQVESLRLYQPLPFQDAYHRCTAKECLLVKGNRSGGSVAGFVEDARAATNQDPYRKYPEKDGVVICVGYGETHIGNVIHKYLFRPGAFDIIPDEKTKEWRVFRPWHRDEERMGLKGDEGRESESMPAPPLIPKRWIKGKPAWVKPAHRFFYRFDLTTGWSIYAANSNGEKDRWQGFNCNLYHIDEDLAKPGWYDEGIARLTQKRGLMRWTAMPHDKNDDLMLVMERYEQDQATGGTTTMLLQASMFDNPYLPKEEVEKNIRIWSSQGEDVVRRRAYGQIANSSVLVYPTFRVSTLDYRNQFTETCEMLKKRNGEVPDGWCRYVSIDPGVTVLALTYWAVPPSGEQVYLYDEDYILGGDAMKFGEAMSRKAVGAPFQAFIIDSHGGNLRELGSGLTPREQFSRQLQQRNIRSVATLFDFVNGCDDIPGREMKMREALSIRQDGSTRLIINVDGCPNFIREMQRFKKKYIESGSTRMVSDESNRRFNTHAIETAEYAIAHGLNYVAPPKTAVNETWVERLLKSEKERKARYRAINGIVGQRTIVLGPQGTSS